MRLFETIKETVTVGLAAEYYGMKIGRNNMICCPFHNDHHPSMKLNTTYYYCFGCGATGDVIQFVANLFGLSNYEAAKKIAVDFGITPDNPPVIAALKKPEYMETKNRQKELCKCQKMVCEYLHRLEKWKALYGPERPDLPMDERFEEACENLSYIEYLADYDCSSDKIQPGTLQYNKKLCRATSLGIYGSSGYYKAVLYRWLYGRFPVYVRTERMDKLKSSTYVRSDSM